MTFSEFEESLNHDQPMASLSECLTSLWYDGKGDWNKAHQLIDHLNDPSSSLVHAYLHRKEGDIWNADYWYRKANEKRPDLSLNEEWKQLVLRFL